MTSKSSEVLGVHISGQLEVFEGVEGDVSVVHHSEDHWDVSTLEGQQLDSSQVRHRAIETETQQGGNQIMPSALWETRTQSHNLEQLVNESVSWSRDNWTPMLVIKQQSASKMWGFDAFFCFTSL